MKQLAQITDDVWHAAGDKSTDYNWYTKRGLLAGVYTATELYMLTDYSPGFADTWDVLDRRLKDVMTIGRVVGQVQPLTNVSCAFALLVLPQNDGVFMHILFMLEHVHMEAVCKVHSSTWNCMHTQHPAPSHD